MKVCGGAAFRKELGIERAFRDAGFPRCAVVDSARDAAEQVAVDYRPLPAVTHAPLAVSHGAALAWHEGASNVCIDSLLGDVAATDAAFGHASHVVRFETWVQRVAGVKGANRIRTSARGTVASSSR